MKRRHLIKAGLISAGAILTGVNVFAADTPKLIKPAQTINLEKQYSGLIRFTSEADTDQVIERVIQQARHVLGNNVNLDFTYIPIGIKDKTDPYGQYGCIGWKYHPSHQTGKSSNNVYFSNSPVFEKLHQAWNKTRYMF